jgi:predicted acetyltransferase
MSLIIRELALSDEEGYRAAIHEFADSGFDWRAPSEPQLPWADYVAAVHAWAKGESLPDGWVPVSTRIAEWDGVLAGRLSVRHELNEFLATAGGHIGYGVRPAFRRRGIATALLREGLLLARGAGVTNVLVTCREDNVGSARVIERCGGVMRDHVEHPIGGHLMRRYDIALAPA